MIPAASDVFHFELPRLIEEFHRDMPWKLHHYDILVLAQHGSEYGL